MAQTEVMPVYTVPSNWTKADCSPTAVAYRRIVGLPYRGEIAWVDPNASDDPNGNYSRWDSERELIPSNDAFRARLVEYFARYIATCRSTDADNADYNCHHFGLWMDGRDQITRRDMLWAPLGIRDDEAPETLLTRRLELGQRGVIISRFRDHTTAKHTVVGLGAEQPDCIQVIAWNGHLGLTSYEQVIDHYKPSAEKANNPDYWGYGLYTEALAS